MSKTYQYGGNFPGERRGEREQDYGGGQRGGGGGQQRPSGQGQQPRPAPQESRGGGQPDQGGRGRPTSTGSVKPGDYGLPEGMITEAELAQDAMEVAQRQGLNVLGPVTEIQGLPVGYAIIFRVVTFNASFDEKDVAAKSNGTYYMTDGGKLALHRSALDALAAAAGLTWIPELCRRVDDRREVLYWEFQMAARYRTFDGEERTIIRSYEVDLRPGSPLSSGMSDNQYKKAKPFGAMLCESKAANRVVRAALSLKSSYTPDEAARPFVFPVLKWIPPTGDAVINRMIAAKELGILDAFKGTGNRFGGPDFQALEGEFSEPGDGSRQLEDHGPARDFAKEGRRLDEQRERVPVERGQPEPAQQRRVIGEVPCVVCGKMLSYGVAQRTTDEFGEALCNQHEQERLDQIARAQGGR